MDWKDKLASLAAEMPAATEIPTERIEPAKPKKLPRLRLLLDKRKGKTATLVLGMENATEQEVEALAKQLKNKLAVGGSTRDGEILLQGDVREKATALLEELGYRI